MRRTATATLLAALIGSSASAQTPLVHVAGLVYTQYTYMQSDSGDHRNTFDVTRAYLSAMGALGDGVGVRVTGEMFPTAALNSLGLRLKFAYASYRASDAMTFKLGLLETPFLPFEEALWGYRMQGSMAMDRAGYLLSADMGASAEGSWKQNLLNSQVSVVNGTGITGPGDSLHKAFMARASVRVLATDDSGPTGGIRLTGYGQFGGAQTGGRRTRAIGLVSYRSQLLTLAGEYAITKDSTAAVNPATLGRVISSFGVLRVPHSAVALLVRADVIDLNINVNPDTLAPAITYRGKYTHIVAGLSYDVDQHLRLAADVDDVVYAGKGVGVVPAGAIQRGLTQTAVLAQAQVVF